MIYQPYNAFPQFSNPMGQQTSQSAIQQNGFIPIRNEQEVLNYPVALGNSVSFIHETEPYVYVKTMGLSQFDKPSIVKYKLIKEELGSNMTQSNNSTPVEVKSLNEDDLKPILDDLKSIHEEIENIKKRFVDIDKATHKQNPSVKEK